MHLGRLPRRTRAGLGVIPPAREKGAVVLAPEGSTAAPGSGLVAPAPFGAYDALADEAHRHYMDGFSARAVEVCRQWVLLTDAAADRETSRYLRYIEAVSLQELGRAAEAVEVAQALLDSLRDESLPVWRAKALAVVSEGCGLLGQHGRSVAAMAEAHWLVGAIPVGTYGHLSASMAVALALRSVNLLEQADLVLTSIEAGSDPDLELLVAQELALLSAYWGASLQMIGRDADARRQFVRTSSRARRMVRVAVRAGNAQMVARGEVIDAYGSMHFTDPLLAAHRARDAAERFHARPELVETHLLLLVLAREAVALRRPAEARGHLEAVIAAAEEAHRDVWVATGRWALASVLEAEAGPHPALPVLLTMARTAMERIWSEREGRFAALRDRHELRELAAETRRTGRAALQDPLTLLGNRRRLELALEAGLSSWAVFVDLDNFKAVNDTWSHSTGDVVLRGVAEILQSQARADDLLIRYGGDEFLILPAGGRAAALAVAERVARAVAEHRWPGLPDTLRLTLSIGVGHTDDSPTDPWMSADAALQRAKRAGRNRIVVFDPSA